MAFKTDTSFLEKISIGAVGTRRVIEHLKKQGYKPIELERGSTSFKIWKKIKIKRIRVPDILCIDCGRRVESRAKTKLQISMSHSFSDQLRGWDNGLEDKDYIAFVVCKRSGDGPVDWQADDLVQYISVGEMRKAYQQAKVLEIKPKGAREGYEARLTWMPHIWMGVTVESQEYAFRIEHLRKTDAIIKFLSLEPLLGPINDLPLEGIDWVIVGGESGPKARPMKEQWVDSILGQCSEAKVPFFFKQWGGVRKKLTGRKLHGRTYDEMLLKT